MAFNGLILQSFSSKQLVSKFSTSSDNVLSICEGFHSVMCYLVTRHSRRPTACVNEVWHRLADSHVLSTGGINQTWVSYNCTVFSERELYAIARPSVCRLSVTLVRPTQAVQIFRNISTTLDILAIR